MKRLPWQISSPQVRVIPQLMLPYEQKSQLRWTNSVSVGTMCGVES